MNEPTLGERIHLRRLEARRHRRTRILDVLTPPGIGWRAAPKRVAEFALVPSDIRPGDPSMFHEFRNGGFPLAGYAVTTGPHSPFGVTSAPPQWQTELHGFGWLNHLASVNSAASRAAGRALVTDWIERYSTPAGIAWSPEVLARRIISWMTHAGLLLDDASDAAFEALLKSLGYQLRHLETVRHTCRPGAGRILCHTALLLADLAIKGREPHRPRSERALLTELDRQIGADGAHAGRNPATVLDLLLDLLPLRRCYVARDLKAPAALDRHIAAMTAHLRLMRRGDGQLARFNGMGTTRVDILGNVLALEPGEAPDPKAQGGGYVRLEGGNTVVHMDAATAPPIELATDAHAGCLSIEVSSGGRPVLVNCGPRGNTGAAETAAARATAHHNTLVLADTSSARLLWSKQVAALCGRAVIAGPSHVTSAMFESTDTQQATDTQQTEGGRIDAAHEGYVASHGLVHSRRIVLSGDGARVDGIDRLAPARGIVRLPRDIPFAIHFHLPPDATPRQDGSGAVDLQFPHSPGWRFTATGAQISIEPTRIDDDVLGPRASLQIALRGATPGDTTVTWVLERIAAADGT